MKFTLEHCESSCKTKPGRPRPDMVGNRNPAHRADVKVKKSCAMKELFQDPEYARSQVAIQKNSEVNKRRSASLKIALSDPETKSRHREGVQRGHRTSKYRKEQSEREKKLWQDPEFRRCQIQKMLESLKVPQNKAEKKL